MKKIKITYTPKGFHKYIGKLLPKWEPEIWTVWKTDIKGQGFRRYEDAVIYQAILEVGN